MKTGFRKKTSSADQGLAGARHDGESESPKTACGAGILLPAQRKSFAKQYIELLPPSGARGPQPPSFTHGSPGKAASRAGDCRGRPGEVTLQLSNVVNRFEGAFMAAFRFIAWVLVAIAIALLGADGVSSLETGEPVMRTTETILGLVGLSGATIVENAPGGVSQALGTIMSLPLWAVIGLIGVVLTLVFRPID